MTRVQGLEASLGKTEVDTSGGKIGSVGQVYLNDQTGQLDWITVGTGVLGTRTSSHGPGRLDGDNLMLPFGNDGSRTPPTWPTPAT